MHVRETVELAGWLVTHRHATERMEASRSLVGLRQYWVASRSRLERWGRALKQHRQRLCHCREADARTLWRLLDPVLEEILTGEILTRVWAALCCAAEQNQTTDDLAPLVRNVMVRHLEARCSAMRMIVSRKGRAIEEVVSFNRLRRRNERWTDMLLSHCVDNEVLSEFSFQQERVRDFALATAGGSELSRGLMLASLRASYRKGISVIAANPDLNAQIAAGILTCFAADQFDGTGVPRSAWIERLCHTATDTAGMIEQLLLTDGGASLPPTMLPTGPRTRFGR